MATNKDATEKVRITSSEFFELIVHLPINDLLKTEYLSSGKWSPMIYFSDDAKKLYRCNVCNNVQYGIKSLLSHLDGKKHKSNMQSVQQLYHPDYTHPKSNKDFPLNKTNQTVNRNDGAKSTGQVVNPAAIQKNRNNAASANATTVGRSMKTPSTAPNKVQAANSENVNKMPAASSQTSAANATVQNNEETAKTQTKKADPKTTQVKSVNIPKTASPKNKQGPGQVKGQNANCTASSNIAKSTASRTGAAVNVSGAKSSLPSTAAKSNKPQQKLSLKPIEVLTNQKVPQNKPAATTNNVKQKSPVAAVKSPEKIPQPTQFQTEEAKASATEHKSDNTNDMDTADNLKSTDNEVVAPTIVKNPFALNIDPAADISASVVEVPMENSIVIELSDSENEQSQKNDRSDKVEKVQSPERNVLEKNPAASASASAKSSNTTATAISDKNEDANNTRYQTDKVIVPTVNKTNSSPLSAKKPESKERRPKFSAKSYNVNDNEIYGLLGVEYVVKIMRTIEDISPRYECGLCELTLDGFAMQKHLTGYNHRLKFCEKHFPTALRHYRQIMGDVPEYEVFKVMTPVLDKLAIAIEEHHGRNLPYECYMKDYNINRHDILLKVYSCRHASEQYGPTFTHVVSAKQIDEFVSQRQNYKPPVGKGVATFDKRLGKIVLAKPNQSSSGGGSNKKPDIRQNMSGNARPFGNNHIRNNMPYMQNINYPPLYDNNQLETYNQNYTPQVDNETHKMLVEDFLRGNMKGTNRSQYGSQKRGRNRSDSNEYDKKRRRLYEQSHVRKSISPLRPNDIWQAYRHMVDQMVNELNTTFEIYKDDPEAHPDYHVEWEKFWRRRKDELIASGVNHRSYNFQIEWVKFFQVRIKELYYQEVENIKIKSRERLCLPMTNDNLADCNYHVNSANVIEEPPIVQPEVIENQTTEIIGPVDDANGEPEVIPVLRLLTALEEQLGSLGPKVIDILSKALQTEKINPTTVNNVVFTPENFSILETAKEKFKGLLIAGILDGPKERALKKAIIQTDALLKAAFVEIQKRPKIQQITPKPLNTMPSTSNWTNKIVSPVPTPPVPPTIVNSVTAMEQRAPVQPLLQLPKPPNITPADTSANVPELNKKDLATKLAATLMAQGKTDVEPGQLEQIIAMYTLIEKKKREANAGGTSEAQPTSTVPTGFGNALTQLLGQIQNQSLGTNAGATSTNQPYSLETIKNFIEAMRRSQMSNQNNITPVNVQNLRMSAASNNNQQTMMQNLEASNRNANLAFGSAGNIMSSINNNNSNLNSNSMNNMNPGGNYFMNNAAANIWNRNNNSYNNNNNSSNNQSLVNNNQNFNNMMNAQRNYYNGNNNIPGQFNAQQERRSDLYTAGSNFNQISQQQSLLGNPPNNSGRGLHQNERAMGGNQYNPNDGRNSNNMHRQQGNKYGNNQIWR